MDYAGKVPLGYPGCDALDPNHGVSLPRSDRFAIMSHRPHNSGIFSFFVQAKLSLPSLSHRHGCRLSINTASRHDRPGYTSCLIRQGYRRKPARLASYQGGDPGIIQLRF